MGELVEKKILVSPEQKELVKSIVFPGCNDNELALFLFECERRGVHPLDRLIFPVARRDGDSPNKKITFQCGIDFFRAEAADTGEYDGQDEPVFGAPNKDGFPEYATVNVYKKGIERPIPGTARWSEFYPGDKQGFMWRKMPFHMLSKCAEVLALRKAFPKRLSGLYIPEEMSAAPPAREPVKTPQRKTAPKAPEAPPAPQEEHTKLSDKELNEPAMGAQVKAIRTMLCQLDCKDEMEQCIKVSSIIGLPENEPVTEISKITVGQAAKVIEALITATATKKAKDAGK